MVDIVKYKDIILAVNKKIKNKFANIKVESEGNVTEKITRPSFFVSLDNLTSSNFVDECLDKNMTVRVYYYPSNATNNKIENLNMIDSLNELFIEDNIIKINDSFAIEIFDEVEIDIVDKIVHFYFNIMTSESIERIDAIELMEELEINTSIK